MNTNITDKQITRHLAAQLRSIRQAHDTTLVQLSGRVDLSYQQLQKYESGVNRISAGKLYKIGCALNTSPITFFEGLPQLPTTLNHDPELIRALLYIKKHPHSEYIGNVFKLLSKEI